MRRIRTAISALALTVAAATLTVPGTEALASPAQSAPATAAAAAVPVAPSEVRNYTWFNTKPQTANEDMHAGVAAHVQRLINAASPGATLSLTLYYFNRKEIIDSLRDAAARGVHVRVVVDGDMLYGNNAWAYAALKAIPTIRLVACDPRPNGAAPVRGCMSDRLGAAPLDKRPINHNKFMTISSVQLTGGGTARNVLYTASANLDYYRAYESALTVTHAGLYQDYVSYFNDLMRHGSSGRVNNNYGKTLSAGAHRVYTFPRREAAGRSPRSASNDPIAALLRQTTCGASGRTLIDLANFRIQRRAVVNELIAAQKRGCRIRVVTGENTFAAVQDLARAVPVRHCGHTEAGGVTVHEKFMIIRRGSQSTLYAGSQNLTYRALRQNDEAVLALRNHAVNGPYQQRFNWLYGECDPFVAPTANATGAADID
ncbi:phosphatidylserine/phosphatidylglycerophosphate/cardiolipin synthase family protein [Streptomyces sp. NPDC018972]|uniref:phosphatidylserine/phosphatidylglycerophosphate/ cardiolipin synthase family protein n=1 Tax=Streptomyces sp. NPDC018972 TaxID=3365060 RepID=UPI0037A0D479